MLKGILSKGLVLVAYYTPSSGAAISSAHMTAKQLGSTMHKQSESKHFIKIVKNLLYLFLGGKGSYFGGHHGGKGMYQRVADLEIL